MPVLCDFELIRGNKPIKIGDRIWQAHEVWRRTFNTGGRRRDKPAFLIFNVKGLTRATKDVPVKINDKVVGYIYPYENRGENYNEWYTQMISLEGSQLNNGDNELEICAVEWSGAKPGHMYDAFYLKNVVIFFRQKT